MNWEADWLSARCRLTPDKTALINADTNERWTFEKINRRAGALASLLSNAGVRRGDRVALLCPNHIAYFDFLFACCKIGALFVPMNWRLSQEELSYVVADCTPAAIGYHSDLEGSARSWNARIMLCVDEEMYRHRLETGCDDFQPADVSLSDHWGIIYTGGTTGKPKGVVLSHRAVWWNAVNTVISWNLSDRDTTLTCLPMFHTGGINALTLPVLLAGGTVAYSDRFDPEQAVDRLIDLRCTVVLMVPTMYHMVVGTERFRDAVFPENLLFVSGGAPCPLAVYDAFAEKGLPFKEGYGMTEAGPNNFFIRPHEAAANRGSVGRPMIFNQIKIVNYNGEEAADGEVGELVLKGGHLFEGYWNNPDATREALRDGWFYTGDLARRDTGGNVFIVGRKKDMIISGGENIYPTEIEQVLLQVPQVKEAVVIGVQDPKWGESVVAVVSLHENEALTMEDLNLFCSGKLGKYKVPKRFEIWEHIPKTAVGKIDKKEIKNLL